VFSERLHKECKNYHVADMYNLPPTYVCFGLREKRPQITMHVVSCFHTKIKIVYKHKLHYVKGWTTKISPCTATFEDLLCFKLD
jgi:hypothetical protein